MNIRKVIFIFFTTIMVLFTIVPFITLILGSLLPNSYIVNGIGIDKLNNITLNNYSEIFSIIGSTNGPPYVDYLKNTLIISSTTVIFVLFLSVFTAYFFSRLATRFLHKFNYLLILTYFFPPIILIYAYFDIYTSYHLHNTLIGLIIPNTAFCYPFSAWLLIGNFNEIPVNYDKSAILDGASRLSILKNIIIRKSFTGLFAVSLFTFVLTWNELVYANYLTTEGSSVRPLSAGVVDKVLNQGDSSQLGLFTAFGTLTLTPLIVIFIFLELRSHKLLLKENKSF